MTLTNYAGTSEYTINYKYPSTVNLGENLTVTVTVIVNELTELKLYLFDWGMQSIVNNPDGQPISQQLSVAQLNDFMYPGSHWGPANITIPISQQNFSLTAGQSYNTSLTLNWIADVEYDRPYSYHFYENDQHVIGNVTVVDNVQSKSVGSGSDYYLVIAIIGIAVAAVAVWLVLGKRLTNKLVSTETIKPTHSRQLRPT